MPSPVPHPSRNEQNISTIEAVVRLGRGVCQVRGAVIAVHFSPCSSLRIAAGRPRVAEIVLGQGKTYGELPLPYGKSTDDAIGKPAQEDIRQPRYENYLYPKIFHAYGRVPK
jgi:hypothetical protein